MLSRSAGRFVRAHTLRQRSRPAIVPFASQRWLSQTRPAFRSKNKKSTLEDEDPFEEAPEDDLFAPATRSPSKGAKSISTAHTSSLSSKGGAFASSKSPEAIFDQQAAFLTDRLGPNPTTTAKQVRSNALRRLLHYTINKSQAERVAEIIALWRSTGRVVDEETTLDFIDRCLLYDPPLLVKVFSNRPKYGLDIPNIIEARRILHKLVTSRPYAITSQGRDAQIALSASILERSSLFAALYPVFGLGSALDDVTSSALLTQACANVFLHLRPKAKHGSPEYRKELAATEEAKEFTAVLPKLVDALRSYKRTLETSGETLDKKRSWGQPFMNDTAGTVHKRMAGQTCETPVGWIPVGLALCNALCALRKLGHKQSEDVVKLLDEVAGGCFEYRWDGQTAS